MLVASANKDDFFGKNFGSILIAMTGIAFAAQIFLPNLWAAKVYNEPDEITEMSWNGTIRKKYTDAKHPSEIHLHGPVTMPAFLCFVSLTLLTISGTFF